MGWVGFRRVGTTGLSELDVDTLALPFFQARAQPWGVAGAVDWRLASRIGMLIRDGRFQGEVREALLMPGGPSVGALRLLLFGLGPYADDPWEVLPALTRCLLEAGAREVAIAEPTRSGRPTTQEEGEDFLHHLLPAVRKGFRKILILSESDERGPVVEACVGAVGLTWESV